MGANMEAARRTGYNILRIHLFVYGYIGALAGVAAFVHAELNQMIQPNSIVGRELEVLAATVLGGASILGGKGKVSGTILGVLLLGVMRNGLILMGVPAYWHQVLFGFIIVAAASMNAIQSTVHSRRRVASPATEAAQSGTVSATDASDSSDERGRQS
jgi:simple sugar transport system permease protein